MPVNFDDPGSLIAYALLSGKAKEQLAAQWSLLPGNRTCCLEPEGCFRSLPKELQKGSSTGALERMDSTKTQTMAPTGLSAARRDLHSKLSMSFRKIQWVVPGQLESHTAAALEWEGQGLREVLTGGVFKEVKADFEDKQGKYSVLIHFAPQFHALRHWMCPWVMDMYICHIFVMLHVFFFFC